MSQRAVTLFRSADHPCPYLPDETSASAFVDPALELSPPLYGRLLEHGFRRSGVHVYRPACPGCGACRAVRIPVADFRPRRSQQRAWRASAAGLSLVPRRGEFVEEHYALYTRYLAARHPEGGMAGGDVQDYERFAFADWCDSLCIELRLRGRLLAVAITDQVPNALSAVYTCFDPDESGRSPGVLAILAQIELARRWGLAHLYLGYWIGDCQKMAYKSEYRPLEVLGGAGWQPVGRGERMPPA